MFGVARDYVAALKVATYGAIPVMLAGATLLVPVMAIVTMVGLCHTLFLSGSACGACCMSRAAPRRSSSGISLVLLAFLSVLVGAAASAIGLI